MAVHQRDHAVDFRIVIQHAAALDLAGDEARHRGRTVHRGENAQIVARTDLAVGAAVALEGRGRHDGCGIAGIDFELVVAVHGMERDVVLMHPVARRNVLRRKADNLAELQRRLILGNRAHRRLVAGRNAARDLHVIHDVARGQTVHRYHDIVGGVKAQERGHERSQNQNAALIMQSSNGR